MFNYLWRRNPLTLLLWAALTLPGLAAIAVIIWSYSQTLAEAERSAADDATIVREHALRVFEAQIGTIAYIDARIAGMSWDEIRTSGEVHQMMQSIANASPHINGLWLIDEAGIGANSADFFPMPPTDASNREYYQALKAADVTHLGEMIRGKLKGNLNFNISRRRSTADGSFDGLILVTSDLDYFETFWQDVKADTSRSVFIARNDGRVLARYPAVEDRILRVPDGSPFYAVAASGRSGSYEGPSLVGDSERLFIVEPLAGFGAWIGVGIDRSALLALWAQRSLLLTLLAAGVTAFLVWIVFKAARAEDRLSDEVVRRRGAEANLIAKEEHVAALEAADTQLRESQARFLALFETSTQGILHLAADSTILDVNPTASAIVGIDAAALIGRNVEELEIEIVDAEGNPLTSDDRPSEIARRSTATLTNVVLGLRAADTGTIRWLQVDAIPQWRNGEASPWSTFLLFGDITEQRRSAQAERILAAEVDHRAKNMLALVQAIVRLSRSESPEQFVEAVEGRIGALSRAHGLLSGSKWGNVDLNAVITEAVAPYRGDGSRDNIAVSGPPLSLKPEAAQPISLLVHELTTNAIKHGALSVPAGVLDIGWSIDSVADELVIGWTERNGPPTSEPARTSFGTRLIRLSVRDDLGGSIVKDWRPEGLHATIRIPTSQLGGRFGLATETKPTLTEDAKHVTAMTGARILVVEDNALIAAELTDHLQRLGCTVIGPAGTLEDAKRLAGTESLDAAILDIDLRGERSFQAAEIARSRNIPIAFCTGYSTLVELAENWADAVIVQKPVSHDEIERALMRLLAHRAEAAVRPE